MFGWIMPEPFVIPAIRTSPDLSSSPAESDFGTMSVVMIASVT